MDMLVKKEKIFDNIVAVSGTKKEAIRTISRLCAKQTMLDATQLEKAFWKREEWIRQDVVRGLPFLMQL